MTRDLSLKQGESDDSRKYEKKDYGRKLPEIDKSILGKTINIRDLQAAQPEKFARLVQDVLDCRRSYSFSWRNK